MNPLHSLNFENLLIITYLPTYRPTCTYLSTYLNNLHIRLLHLSIKLHLPIPTYYTYISTYTYLSNYLYHYLTPSIYLLLLLNNKKPGLSLGSRIQITGDTDLTTPSSPPPVHSPLLTPPLPSILIRTTPPLPPTHHLSGMLARVCL